MLRWLLVMGLMSGCAERTTPLVEAHRGAAGYWPQNSRMAMQQSIRNGFDGIEFDLVLTKDRVPVLAHDPWVHPELCSRTDGSPVGEVLFMDLTWETVQDRFRCGGVPDPDFPQARIRSETILSLDELLQMIRDGDEPRQRIHIDIKHQPGSTEAPEVFAEAIGSRWLDADLPNPWVVSSQYPHVVRAFDAWGAMNNREVPTLISWPFVEPGRGNVAIALEAEGERLSGAVDFAELAEEAGADGVSLYWELADRSAVKAAHDAGVEVSLWTVNDPKLMRHLQRWSFDILITDYPGESW